jgi:hypothetical protein
MRVNPTQLMKTILIISCIFGVLAFVVAILAGNDIVKAIASVLLFLLGFIAAKIHNNV